MTKLLYTKPLNIIFIESSITWNIKQNCTIIQESTFQASSSPSITITTVPSNVPYRRPYKTNAGGRPRGRPPNVKKFNSQYEEYLNQASKSNYSNYLNNTGNPLMNPFCLSPFNDPNMLVAMLTGLGNNVMDPLRMNFVNQEIIRQYQNSISMSGALGGASSSLGSGIGVGNASVNPGLGLSSLAANFPLSGNLFNIPNSSASQSLLHKHTDSATSTSTTSTIPTSATGTTPSTKDRPDISITPVTSSAYKLKASDFYGKSSKPVSLLKNPQQGKPLTKPVQSSSQIRVHPKTDLQSQSVLRAPPPKPLSTPGTSLQHKLLSKKQTSQQFAQAKKPKTHKSMSSCESLFRNITGPGGFRPSPSSGISVSAVVPQSAVQQKVLPPATLQKFTMPRKPVKPRQESSAMAKNRESMNALTQLQQHPHLEVFPHKQQKPSVDFPKNLSPALTIVPQSILAEAHKGGAEIFEIPRKASTSGAKRVEKPPVKDSVEIITLDD